MEKDLTNKLDNFLSDRIEKTESKDGKEQKICDLQTGECYTIREKDGIVERVNKTYVVEDGRQILID